MKNWKVRLVVEDVRAPGLLTTHATVLTGHCTIQAWNSGFCLGLFGENLLRTFVEHCLHT